jgi:hypothetical protein
MESQSAAEAAIDEPRFFRTMAIPAWIDPLPAILAALAMLWWTWNKWPDILINFGRELYVPWQLSLGKVLYIDIAYFNGPVSPYFNSLWFRLFGPRLIVLVFANLAFLLLLIFLVCALARKISGRTGAVAASLVFVAIFAFGDYSEVGNYNYVCPYSHEMVHGVLLSFGALLCMMIYCDTSRMSALFAAGLLTGLVLLTKAEIFLALFCAMSVALTATLLLKRAKISTSLKAALGFPASAILPPLIGALSMTPALGPAPALKGVAGSFYHLFANDKVAKLPFYVKGMGTDDIGGNLVRMLTAAGATAAFLAGAAALGILFPYSARRHPASPAAAFVMCGLVFWFAFRIEWLTFIGRPFPLFMLVIAVTLTLFIISLFRRGCFDPHPIQQLALVVFSLMLLGKMLLNSRIDQYEFVLAMPAAMILTVLVVDWLPEWVSRSHGYAGAARAAGAAILFVVAVQFILLANSHLAAKTVRVSNGSDEVLTYPRGIVVNEGIGALRTLMKPGETMAVVPEGVMLNYLVRVDNPTPYINYLPPDVLMFGEEKMLAAFKAHPPDYIVAVPHSFHEYGVEGFGEGYATDLASWIVNSYEELKTVAPEATRKMPFGKLYILRRKNP